MSKELKEYFNEQQQHPQGLAGGAQARAQDRAAARRRVRPAPADVMWHLMAMRRYGEVLDGPEQDGYVLYRLKGAYRCSTTA